MYQEAILYRPVDGTLIIPDLLSTSAGYPVKDERIGVMLAARLVPPREVFADMEPERILFGHGEGVFENAATALDTALASARKNLPAALVRNFWENLRLYRAANT